MKKRILAAALSVCLLVGLLPAAALAAEDGENDASFTRIESEESQNVAAPISGIIATDMVWNDRDIINGVTISGGTKDDPIEITVNGTVTIDDQIMLDRDTETCVVIKGTNPQSTLIRGVNNADKAMIWSEGNSARTITLTIENLILDGGAVWGGTANETLGRGTSNSGIASTGTSSAILFLRYSDVALTNVTVRNQDARGGKAPAINLGNSVLKLNQATIQNNYFIGNRGGAIHMRDAAMLIAKDSVFCGNHGETGGVIGTGTSSAYNSVVKVTRCSFYNNYATKSGAVFCNQDFLVDDNIGETTIIGCTFYNNESPRGLIYSHAYQVPTTIQDSKFYQNKCAVYEYSQANTNLFFSGKVEIAEDLGYSKYLFRCPPVIIGALSDGSSISMSEATIKQLMGNFGYIMTGTADYAVDDEDVAKVKVPDGYATAFFDSNADDVLDVIVVKIEEEQPKPEDIQYVDLTLVSNLNGSTEQTKYRVPIGVLCVIPAELNDGYEFVGWANSADATSGSKTYSASAETTLYGVWKKCAHTTKTYTAEGAVLAETCSVCGHVFKTATLTAPENLTYDGNEKAASIVTSGNWEDGDLTITYTGTTGAPTNAGEYTAQITVGGATASIDFTIAKAAPVLSISADKAQLSGSGTVNLTVDGVPEGSIVTVTCDDESISVASNEDGTYSATLPGEAKAYTFTAAYAGDANHEAASETCTVTVSAAPVVVPSYTVKVDEMTNGTVETSRQTAPEGRIITLTVTPDAGYKLASITVTTVTGKELTLTDKGDGKYTFVMPGSKVTVSATFTSDGTGTGTEQPLPFVDVDKDAYYYEAVKWAVENGITEGTSATTFSPNGTCTRAQIVTFLWRAAGCPEPVGNASKFTDVETGSFYEKAVAWAIEQGITLGTSETTFSPHDTCVRAQIATFLWRYSGKPAATGDTFADVPADAYYAEAVAWAVENAITIGTSETTFSPYAPSLRAQAVTMIYRSAAE